MTIAQCAISLLEETEGIGWHFLEAYPLENGFDQFTQSKVRQVQASLWTLYPRK
jgi:hypothetical protein